METKAIIAITTNNDLNTIFQLIAQQWIIYFSGKILVALGQWNYDQNQNNFENTAVEIVDLINLNSKWNGPVEGFVQNQSIIQSGYCHNLEKMIQNYDFDSWECDTIFGQWY